ncbi:hypothetical protein ACFQU2_17355 [Siccirubricoccus deserti]
MDDRRGTRPSPGCGVPRRGLHPAEDHVPAGQDRLFAILHLLHLAQREGRDHRVSGGAGEWSATRVLPAAFLRQHAGHQPDLPAGLRSARLPDPCRAGDDALRPLGYAAGLRLCEAAAMPGREEYLDSDKYEIRARPDRAPGDIVDEITRLNAIRRANPALQTHLGLAFHQASNPNVIWYRKATPDRDNVLLIAVSLDPHNAQETDIELPLWEWGLPDSAALAAEDLMRGHRFTWQGKAQRLRLDPGELPFGIWRVRPEGDL